MRFPGGRGVTLTVLERGKSQYKNLPEDSEDAYAEVVAAMRQQITSVDDLPFSSEDTEWSKLFDTLGMWR
jgi:hypothetical protein